MKHHPRTLNVVLACTPILLGFGSLPLYGQDSKSAATKKQTVAATALPSLWTSLSTKKEFRVRIDKDRFSAEWIAPPEAAKKGAYIRTECRRSGDKWIGISHVFVLCSDSGEGKKTTGCPLTVRFEVDSITADRISGRSETPRGEGGFDCQKCQVRQMGWGNFVWVPKGKAARGAGRSAATTADKK